MLAKQRLSLIERNLRAFSTSDSRHPIYNIQVDRKERSITLVPKESHKSSLIWLHGLGDSANGFADVFLNEEYAWTPPHVKVILLTAPERPVTLNGGMVMNSWYDIYSLRGDYIKSLDELFDKYSREEMLQSVQTVSAVIDKEIELLGDSRKVYIGGFSQGCALSLATMILYPKILGGLFCLSGMNALKIDWSRVAQEKKEMPIFVHHGEADDVIQHKVAIKTYQEFIDNGFKKMEIKTEKHVGHSLSERELQRMRQYVRERLNSMV
ncbi:hypothetical protein FGO68_gene16404 [Halteria grandinella]|uniref:Phospholipase/carboxylesterase/thioesterase domain-containing protein n=1 Tax=Halteria grandinella TaxID=5974 RepID=A0A8J8NER6_HALGN|nr:hypothetical protein FGO68_gene16404 [Halteria grandinella]